MRACSQNRSRRPCPLPSSTPQDGPWRAKGRRAGAVSGQTVAALHASVAPVGGGTNDPTEIGKILLGHSFPLRYASRRKSGYRGNLEVPAAPPMHTTGRTGSAARSSPPGPPVTRNRARLRLGGVCQLRSCGPIIHAASAAAIHGNVWALFWRDPAA